MQSQHDPGRTERDLTALVARREAVTERLKRILIEDLHLDCAPAAIELDAPLFGTGLGLDSVDALELVVAAERAFEIALTQESLRPSLRTLNTFADVIVAEVAAKEARHAT
jgi:acyl carrier protein